MKLITQVMVTYPNITSSPYLTRDVFFEESCPGEAARAPEGHSNNGPGQGEGPGEEADISSSPGPDT
jgi:hypothetical protein